MSGDRARDRTLGPGLLPVVLITFGAPLAWVAHLLVSYFLVGLACSIGWRGLSLAIALTAVTVLTLAATVASGVVAWRRWRAGGTRAWDAVLSDAERETWDDDERDRAGREARFLWLLGVLFALFFFVVILFEGVPPYMLRPCT